MNKRRIVSIVIAALFVFVTISIWSIECEKKERLAQLTQNGQLIYNEPPIQAYLKDENYVIAITKNLKTVKGIEFSQDRQVIKMFGIEPVEIADISRYLNKTLGEIEAELGTYHIDIGSGHFMPSYITTDGYLVCFTFIHSKEKNTHVGKTDLFTREAVEWYFSE